MSDILDVAPSLPRYEAPVEAGLLLGRQPTQGEFLGASVASGWWGTTVGQLGAQSEVTRGGQDNAAPLSRQEWDASGLARERLEWREGMTRGQAEAMTRIADDRAYRERLMAARDPGAFEAVLGFGGQMLGAIPDPVNFVPIAGPLARGLRAVGATRAAGVLTAPGVAASAGRGVVDAVGGNALAAPLVYASQAQFGEEITFDRVVADLAIGALIGAGFGTVGGLIGRRVQPDAMPAVRALDAVASDVAAGRPVDVPAGLAGRAIEDAVLRSAPVDLQGVRLADLPAAPDGGPVSRAEFAALVERERQTRVATLDDFDARDRSEAEGQAGARSVAELLADLRRGEDRPQGQKSLTQFVVEQGGIRDERGDVRNMMGDGSRTRPGLLNNAGGRAADEMAERAYAAGYFPEFGRPETQAQNARASEFGSRQDRAAEAGQGMTSRAFIEALDDDLNKSRMRYGETEDMRAAELSRAAGDLDTLLERNGANINDPPERVLEVLRGLREDAPGRSLDDLIRDEADYAWYREALTARDHMDRMASTPQQVAPEADAPRAAGDRAADDADPAMEAALGQIEAMRAAGMLNDADIGMLRAGDDLAGELDATARGTEEAGECLIRNIA